MKPNAFQKILALIYLVLISVCCIFYVPFRNTHGRYKTEIVYDAIWSDNSNIDLYFSPFQILVNREKIGESLPYTAWILPGDIRLTSSKLS